MKNLAASALSAVIAASVAWALSDGGRQVGSIPIVAVLATLAFLINWAAFVPSWLAKTERYYDLVGSATYITTAIAALTLSGDLDARSWAAGIMVIVWAARLGSFLFRRILDAGSDSRFDRIKTDAARLFMTWTLQGLWVTLTSAAAWTIITSEERQQIGAFAVVGFLLWAGGLAIEAIADQQKSAFKSDPANDGDFISTGLWAWSRHPNYFGEITLWVGLAVMAIPVLDGWQWCALVSPVFVTLLLTKISGIPLLERKAEKRWGDDPSYRRYVASTPVLLPLPPSD